MAADDEQAIQEGLRFIHMMEVDSRLAEHRLAVEIGALTDLLIAKGLISSRELDERKDLARMDQAKRDAKRRLPMISGTVDKYAVTQPDIPCAENLALCGAACCRLVFDLSLQDLDEGIVKWEYGRPYRIRHVNDQCVHLEEGRGCNVYQHRPAICRSYDCRKDERIWIDYEKRIPNPDVHKLNRPPTPPPTETIPPK
jgi:hypothetical protein